MGDQLWLQLLLSVGSAFEGRVAAGNVIGHWRTLTKLLKCQPSSPMAIKVALTSLPTLLFFHELIFLLRDAINFVWVSINFAAT